MEIINVLKSELIRNGDIVKFYISGDLLSGSVCSLLESDKYCHPVFSVVKEIARYVTGEHLFLFANGCYLVVPGGVEVTAYLGGKRSEGFLGS